MFAHGFYCHFESVSTMGLFENKLHHSNLNRHKQKAQLGCLKTNNDRASLVDKCQVWCFHYNDNFDCIT